MTFPECFEAFITLLERRQSANEGGWTNQLDGEHRPLSIVNTAQALEMLRCARVPYESPRVRAGLGYIAAKSTRHPRAVHAGGEGRGVHSRYVAYAVWGLALYEEARHQPEYLDPILKSVRWLHEHRAPGGGWGDPDLEVLSLTPTMPALFALHQLRHVPLAKLTRATERLASQARAAVQREVRGRGSKRWWAQRPGGPPSGAATALAVLSLADGADDQRRLAQQGVAWLLDNPTEWVDRVEHDYQLDSLWRHMAASLGVRAVLHRPGRTDIEHQAVRAALLHLESLWNPQGGWGFTPGAPPSVAASFAVVAAALAVRRAYPFDPFAVYHRGTRRGPRRFPSPPARDPSKICINADGRAIVIRDEMDVVVARAAFSTRAETQWRCVREIVARHMAHQHDPDARRRTLTSDELAAALGDSVTSVRRIVHRVNAQLESAVPSRRPPAIIEERRSDGEPQIVRWGLAGLHVEVSGALR